MKKNLAEFERKYGKGRVRALSDTLQKIGRARAQWDLESPTDSNSIQFGVIGDTHFGSLYEAKDQLRAFYARLRSEGIKTVLHAGDVLDGHRLYKGQEFELHCHGWAAQRNWFAELAKESDGLEIQFVTGNHDDSLKHAAGIDVGEELEHVAPGWHFLGETQGRIAFTCPNGRRYVVAVMHPKGGTAYAISYKPQKIAEQIEGGSKPNMLVVGHFHKSEFLPSYRNIAVIQAGCFQRQTPHMAASACAAHVGGWIVRVSVGSDASLSNTVRAEFVAFYG